MNRVLVDTSSLLSICETKADLFEIEKVLGKVEYCVTSSVLYELEKLSRENLNKKKCLNILKQLMVNFTVIDDKEKYVDSSFIKLADKDYIYVTNDSELSRELKKKGRRVFRLSNKKRFVEI